MLVQKVYLSMTKDKLFKYAICIVKKSNKWNNYYFCSNHFSLLCVEGIGLPEQTHNELRKLRNR